MLPNITLPSIIEHNLAIVCRMLLSLVLFAFRFIAVAGDGNARMNLITRGALSVCPSVAAGIASEIRWLATRLRCLGRDGFVWNPWMFSLADHGGRPQWCKRSMVTGNRTNCWTFCLLCRCGVKNHCVAMCCGQQLKVYLRYTHAGGYVCLVLESGKYIMCRQARYSMMVT